jgi:hypothetical protein
LFFVEFYPLQCYIIEQPGGSAFASFQANWVAVRARAQNQQDQELMQGSELQSQDSQNQYSQNGYSIDIGSEYTQHWRRLTEDQYRDMSFDDLRVAPQPPTPIYRPLAARVKQLPISTSSVLEPTTMPGTKKRPSTPRKSRAKKLKPVNTIDLEAESEASKEDNCWQDSWIRELIGFRQEMDEYFEDNVKK